jgi:hypothetical protein
MFLRHDDKLHPTRALVLPAPLPLFFFLQSVLLYIFQVLAKGNAEFFFLMSMYLGLFGGTQCLAVDAIRHLYLFLVIWITLRFFR